MEYINSFRSLTHNMISNMRFVLIIGLFLISVGTGYSQTLLTANAAAVTGTTTMPGAEFSPCNPGGNNYKDGSSHPNYFYYEATADNPCASVTMAPTEQFTKIFVFADNVSDPLGTGYPTTDAVACIAEAASGVFGNMDPVTANFQMSAGMRYYFMVTTWQEGTTTFDINFTITPVPTPYVTIDGFGTETANGSGAFEVADGTALNFYDTGGPNCDYKNGESHTITVCPDAAGLAADKIVQLDFTNFNLNESACADTEINIYKGEGVLGDKIFPGQYANIVHQQDIQIFSSIVAGGCMTVEWTSHAADCEGEGWEAQFTLIDNPCSSPVEDVCGLSAPLLAFGESISANTECFNTATGTACGVGGNNGAWLKVIAEDGVDNISIDYTITGGNACYATDDIATGVDEPTNDEIANNTGLQLLLYRGCGSDELCASNPILATGGVNVNSGVYASGTWTSDISVATIGAPPAGNVYYVRITSFGGDLCDFSLTGAAGVAPVSTFNCEANAGTSQN